MLVAEWPSDGGDVWHCFVQWENTQPSCECRPSNKLATKWQKLLFSFLSNILFLFCSQGNWNTNKLSNLNKGIALVTGRGRKLGFLVLEHLWITMLGMVFYNIQNFSWNCYEEKVLFFSCWTRSFVFIFFVSWKWRNCWFLSYNWFCVETQWIPFTILIFIYFPTIFDTNMFLFCVWMTLTLYSSRAGNLPFKNFWLQTYVR